MRNAYLQMCEYGSRFRILKGGKISLVVSAFIASVTLLQAAPTGGVVTSGSASIAQSGSVTNITQSTQKAAINWQNFSIGATETVNFNQPNVSAITLNRVVGNEKSIIDGALNANGQVFILNSNGLLFSKNASINTAGLVATTMNLSDADFNAGNYAFKGDSSASIINQGTINISDKGYAALFGKEVVNEGIIKATLGKVHLTGASELTLNLNGNSLVNLTVTKGALDALVENKGAIYADGGEVYLTTNAVNELLKGVVNNTGIVEANTLDDITGKIELFAHGGEAKVGGTLKAEGGFIETSGKEFTIAEGTIVKAREWLIDPVNITIDAALASTLQTTLLTGDAIVTTSGAGADEGNINVNANISWSSHLLTLTATNNINVNALMSATGSAALTMTTGASGRINMGINSDKTAFTGKINYLASGALIINTDVYTVITSRSDLAAISTDGASLAGKYVLGEDIDLSTGGNWTPIWDSVNSTPFSGSFDGLGHTISNMTIGASGSPYSNRAGLFGKATNAKIGNIAITDAQITTQSAYNGIVAGYFSAAAKEDTNGDYTAAGGASLYNTIATGTIVVVNNSDTGGAIGRIYSDSADYNSQINPISIDNVHANVDISGNMEGNIGGFTGSIYSRENNAITITNSRAISTISTSYAGAEAFGGFAGSAEGGINLSKLYAKTSISTTDSGYFRSDVGGLLGWTGNDGGVSIDQSIADFTFTSDGIHSIRSIGGLAGYITSTTISNSFASGSITNDATGVDDVNSEYIGGLVGNAEGSSSIDKSYANVDITLKSKNFTQEEGGFWGIGGLIGAATETGVTNSVAFGDISITQGTMVASSYTIAGGVIGVKNEGAVNITNNIYAGTITVTSGTVGDGILYKGGIVGGSWLNNSGEILAGWNDSGETVSGNKFDGTLNPSITPGAGEISIAINKSAEATYVGWDFTDIWAIDSNINNGTPHLKWAASMFASSTPEPTPTPDPTPESTPISKIVDAIVSGVAVQPPRMPNFTPPTPPAPPSQQFSFGGQQVQLASTPSGDTPTQIIGMQEARAMMQGGGTGDVRIPLGQNSLIQLVNGGLRLPESVEQEFFMAQR